MSHILDVEDLEISFDTDSGSADAVRGVSFHLEEGETLGVVGESGSGKSVTAESITARLPKPFGRVKGGSIRFRGKELTTQSDKQMRSIRGGDIAMVFQDPMTSLNPTMTIGRQIIEVIAQHRGVRGASARVRAIEILTLVRISNPGKRLEQYPHQLSGGMRQRVAIAIALAGEPKVLIADEPTTALDVTIQSQILDLLRDVQAATGTAIIMITHDLGVVANVAHRVAVMYGGKIVETGSVEDIFYSPRHPYTWGLLASMPHLAARSGKLASIPGTPPSAINPPKGCPFTARCPYAMNICEEEMPASTTLSASHSSACWLLDNRAPDIAQPTASMLADTANLGKSI